MCQDNYHVGLLGGSGPYPTVSPPSSLVSSVADSANLEVGFTRQLLWTRDPARLLDYTDDSLACDSRFHWIGSNRQFPLALVAIAGFGLNRFRYFSTPGETTSSGPLPLVISPALTADPVNVESSREELAQESSGQRIAEPSATGGNKKKRSAPSSSASVEARAGSEPDEPPTKRKKKEKKKKRTVGERSEHSEDVGGRELVAFDSSNRISVLDNRFVSVTVLGFRHLQLSSSTTRGLRWDRTLESSTLLALDSLMIERRSSLEMCMRSVVCDFRLSLFLKSFDSSGAPFSLGHLLECSCESRTSLSSSSSEEELDRARMTWTHRRLQGDSSSDGKSDRAMIFVDATLSAPRWTPTV
ncbi:hypothetical protein F2Q68_00040046 [Brassica cretica]|uniref:Uncharacterized protein n=1 Tax=Brassica cretica TaxID=69181 RepID=A0A8S9MNN0_BRACR|nr:hypothetical protein F2Q68_00040046 [Brassica cretica]